jgi:hypothetical protein
MLVFVAGVLLVAYAWAVLDTKSATGDAARQAVRTYVESPDPSSAGVEATAAAQTVMAGYGRRPDRASVSVVGGTFERCGRVSIEVAYPAPLLELPFFGSLGRGGTVRSVHSELVDPYRSGLAGQARCAA